MKGYYRFPTLIGDAFYFVTEDDIWKASEGGGAERLTTYTGAITSLRICPGGRYLAFSSDHEGKPDIFLLDLKGGLPRRLTYLDGTPTVVEWKDSKTLVIRSDDASPHRGRTSLYTLSIETGKRQKLPVGYANSVSWTPQGKAVIQRHGYGYTTWKNYRGGAAGELWIEREKGTFAKLLDLPSNNLKPLCVGERIYFLSDHEEKSGLYSVNESGEDLKAHVVSEDFYIRDHATDGQHIIFQKGGDLGIFDPQTNKHRILEFTFQSPRRQWQRFLASPQENLTSYTLSPKGENLGITTRGRAFSLPPFQGAVLQLGKPHDVRYRLMAWLTETDVVLVCDAGESEDLEIWSQTQQTQTIKGDWGRLLEIYTLEKDRILALNHRHEFLKIDLKTGAIDGLDKSAYGPIDDFDVSKDGSFVVYSFPISHTQKVLKACNLKTGETTLLTTPLYEAFSPCFDETGQYLFFLSQKNYTIGAPPLIQPYVMTLQPDAPNPFDFPERQQESGDEKDDKSKKIAAPNFQDCKNRIVPLPLSADLYEKLGATEGKLLLLRRHTHPQKKEHVLDAYDLNALKKETLIEDIQDFTLSEDRRWMAYHTRDKKVRVLKAGERPEDGDSSYKKSGWVDLDRIHLNVHPQREWNFMFHEAWRLQRDLFWREDMGEVDWDAVLKRYTPRLERLGSTQELFDLIGEMQGELRSSHAYTFHTPEKQYDYRLGHLGASFIFDEEQKGWRLHDFTRVDEPQPDEVSPLLQPGAGLREDDVILSINGQRLDAPHHHPGEMLLDQAESLVQLSILRGKTPQVVHVRPFKTLRPLYYRLWVQKKRAYVRQASENKLGYIHIPDMSSAGFEEFYRSYVQEFDYPGLVIDVRYNRGGNISSTLLSQLLRKRLGFDQTRFGGRVPYMDMSPQGPMIVLANEFTASDGDMFTHSFKMLKLGKVVGKRTWGGVIGIFPRHPLLDGTLTSQPEYSFWFHDVGWRLENGGAVPDIEVENTPQDEAKGNDPQLDRAIQEIKMLICPDPAPQ